MKILLDECLPRRLKSYLAGHECKTAPEMGWASKSNGELLKLASGRFDVFVTIDAKLAFQQNVSDFQIAVITLAANSNRLEALTPLVAEILASLADLRPGQVRMIGGAP
jgi:hypothetical protein